MGFRSIDTPERHFSEKYKDQMDQLAQDHERARQHFRNHVMEGGFPIDPTTTSQQFDDGLGGELRWRINIEKVIVVVDGVLKHFPLQVDWVVHTGSKLNEIGQRTVAALVARNISGTVSLMTVKGTPATIGSAVGPSDSVIDSAVGVGNEWIKVAETWADRPSNTVVTQTHNPAARPMLAANVDTGYGDWEFIKDYFPRK